MEIKANIVFIDDGPDQTGLLISPIIRKLWRKGIRSSIVILGDFERTDNNLSLDNFNLSVEKLKSDIQHEFSSYMISEDCFSDEQILEHYPLINKNYSEEKSNTVKKIEVDIVDDFNNDKDVLFTQWKTINKKILKKYYTNDNINFDKFKQDYSLDDFVDEINIDKNFIIALDMCLLEGDLNKLMNDTEFPIFSIGLYSAFIKKGYDVIMYTTYDCTNEMVDRWKKTCEKFYDCGEPKFFNRRGKEIKRNSNDNEAFIKEIESKIQKK
ncbi:MAG: hypothetical protein NC213_00085 [Acetobacter sp.]|nr:hypothetical protein [Bacteroides sp.]MCM1340123.1 hypothetical protein [Acetobacter sp.]MCM1432705.1 hypothetical protein [Clostridiales bacterium]